jgi:hypothetical protein
MASVKRMSPTKGVGITDARSSAPRRKVSELLTPCLTGLRPIVSRHGAASGLHPAPGATLCRTSGVPQGT